MTEQPTRPKPEFWDDYEPKFPPGSLSQIDSRRIDRTEMVNLIARDYGDKLTENQLRYWENERWVPLPRRGGSPPRALYPAWASVLLAHVIFQRIQGRSGDEIRSIIKRNLERPSILLKPFKGNAANAPGYLYPELRKLAELYEQHSGRSIGEAEIILRDTEDRFVARVRYDIRKPEPDPVLQDAAIADNYRNG